MRGRLGCFVALAGGEPAHLLVERVLVCLLVFDPVEVLAVDVGERGAVAGVVEEEVEDRPDQCQAAGLAGEAAHHLGAPADLAERPLEQVRAAPPFAVPERVAQMDNERVEVLGQAAGGRFVAAMLELSDQDLEAELAVPQRGRVGQR